MAEIACLGVLVADLLARPVDGLPPKGRLGLVERMELHVGGCAANTGVDLARLGVSTAVLGKVGADGLGDFLVRGIEAAGADVRGIVRDPAVNTSGTMVLVSGDGERTFVHYQGANGAYRAEDVAWDVLAYAKILHVAGAHIMPAFDGQPMAEMLAEAKRRGLTTALDVVWDASGRWLQTLGPSLPHADYFLPSLHEARAMTGRDDPHDVARALLDSGAGTVGLKLGAEGCLLVGPGVELRMAAYRVPAVDGTGSGDAWDAGLLCGVLKGWDLERAARFANACGALCVQAMGATTGACSLDEVEAFVKREA